MIVNKAFFKATDGHFARGIVYRKGKFITRTSIHSKMTKRCNFHRRSCPISVNLLTGCWLISTVNGATSEKFSIGLYCRKI